MPVTTLTGKNAYQISSKLSKLRADFASVNGATNVLSLDGETCSYDDLSAAVFEQGLFSQKSLVLLSGVSSNKFLQEKLLDQLESIPEDAHLVIVDSKLDKRTAFFKALKKNTDLNDFPEADEYGLSSWVTEEFRAMGGEIKPADASVLVGRVGADQWALKNELDKLINHPQPVTRKTIEEVVDMSFRETIFSLLDLAFSKQTDKTIEAYRDLVANRIDPYYIMSMIAWQLHVMLGVAFAGNRSAEDIAKQAKLSPYVVRKSQAAARQTNKTELASVATRFVEVDYQTKTSASTDVETLVEQLLIKIAS